MPNQTNTCSQFSQYPKMYMLDKWCLFLSLGDEFLKIFKPNCQDSMLASLPTCWCTLMPNFFLVCYFPWKVLATHWPIHKVWKDFNKFSILYESLSVWWNLGGLVSYHNVHKCAKSCPKSMVVWWVFGDFPLFSSENPSIDTSPPWGHHFLR